MNQTTAKVTLGIDVSKSKLDVYLSPMGNHSVITNERRAIGNWCKTLIKRHGELQVALEPTGGYEKQVVKALLAARQTV